MLVYTHNRTKEEYLYIGSGKFKHPSTREWVETISYVDRAGKLYHRTVDDFHNSFTLTLNLIEGTRHEPLS